MSENKITFVTPVGRMVQGDLYKPNTTDNNGQPLVVKSGPNKGQPRQEIFFALAIPKGTERAWWETQWGAQIHQAAQRDWPQGQFQNENFAWKVIDGDSTKVDQTGKRPCDKQGFPGHWVLRLSSGYTPIIVNADGTQQLTQPDQIKCGDYIQAQVSVGGNGNTMKPGMFLNHHVVALAGHGERFTYNVDTAAIGFGKAPLPTGVSKTPVAGGFNPAVPMAAAPSPMAAPSVPYAAAPAPAPEVLMPPVAAPAPAAPVAPVAPGRVMTAKAAGVTYEAFLAQGWTDATLVQHGYMVG